MKDMIQRMTDLENEAKQQLNESEQLAECPPEIDEGPDMAPQMAPQMDQGNPVTMNINLNASGKEHVADLIDMMKNAGLGDAKPASDAMMPVRQDMERLSAMMDEPGDEDPNEELEPVEDEVEEYANSPDGVEGDPEYSDHELMTKDLSGGINREKKAYAAAQDGDNAMAVEAIRAQLMAALQEKKKPDTNKNGIPDYAEDGKVPNDPAKGKKKGSKPKKGQVPPQFKKK